MSLRNQARSCCTITTHDLFPTFKKGFLACSCISNVVKCEVLYFIPSFNCNCLFIVDRYCCWPTCKSRGNTYSEFVSQCSSSKALFTFSYVSPDSSLLGRTRTTTYINIPGSPACQSKGTKNFTHWQPNHAAAATLWQ